jgi:hypothetical protein
VGAILALSAAPPLARGSSVGPGDRAGTGSELTFPALSIAGPTRVLTDGNSTPLVTEWNGTSPGCALTPAWYRWSTSVGAARGTLNVTYGATVRLLAEANASGPLEVQVRAAVTEICGAGSTTGLVNASATFEIGATLELGNLSVAPSLLLPGASTNLTATVDGGIPPYRVTVAWGDGSVDVTTLNQPEAIRLSHAYAAGVFVPHVDIVDALNDSALGSPEPSVLVGPGPSIALTTPDPVGEIGAAVPFSIAEEGLPSNAPVLYRCAGPGAPAPLPNASAHSFDCTFLTAGTYSVTAIALGRDVTGPIAAFNETVVPAVGWAGPVQVPPVDAGAPLVASVDVTGGIPPFELAASSPGLPTTTTERFYAEGTERILLPDPGPGNFSLRLSLSDALRADVQNATALIEVVAPPTVAGVATNSTQPNGTAVSWAGAIAEGLAPFDWTITPSSPTEWNSTGAGSDSANGVLAWSATFPEEGSSSVLVQVVDADGLYASAVVSIELVPRLGISLGVTPSPWNGTNFTNVSIALTAWNGLAPFAIALDSSLGIAANGSMPADGTGFWNFTVPDVGIVRWTVRVVDALGIDAVAAGSMVTFSPSGPGPGPSPGPTPNGTTSPPDTVAGDAGALLGAVALLAVVAAVAILLVLRRRRRSTPEPVAPDPIAVLRELIAPADGADRATIELLAEERGIPIDTVTATIDRLVADGRLRAERSPDGEEALTWFEPVTP